MSLRDGTPLADRLRSVVRRRIARRIFQGIRRPLVMPLLRRPSETEMLGLSLRTHPEVFHPVFFSSSRILAEHVVRLRPRGLSVLDMGTGAGPIALAAAAAGAVVTACDRNPSAVRLTRENAARNRLAVEVVQSDLYEALGERAFDLITFNIPFYPTEPTTHLESAFRAGKGLTTVRRFATGAPRHLAHGGRVVIVFSEDCERGRVMDAFRDAGLAPLDEEVTTRHFERFHVASFRRSGGAKG